MPWAVCKFKADLGLGAFSFLMACLWVYLLISLLSSLWPIWQLLIWTWKPMTCSPTASRTSFLGVYVSHRALCVEGSHTWFLLWVTVLKFLILLKGKVQNVFILYQVLQIVSPVLMARFNPIYLPGQIIGPFFLPSLPPSASGHFGSLVGWCRWLFHLSQPPSVTWEVLPTWEAPRAVSVPSRCRGPWVCPPDAEGCECTLQMPRAVSVPSRFDQAAECSQTQAPRTHGTPRGARGLLEWTVNWPRGFVWPLRKVWALS